MFTLFASSVLHYQTINILKEENNRANSALLTQFRNTLDDKLFNMSKLATKAYVGAQSVLLSTNNPEQTKQNKLTPYTRYKIRNFLSTLNVAEDIENMFIYYSEEDNIISLDSSISSNDFFQTYYDSGYFTQGRWNSLLNSTSIKGFITFPSKSKSNTIAYIYYPIIAGKIIESKVVVVFNPSILQKILSDNKLDINGAFLILNSEGELLASTNPDYNNIDLLSYFNEEDFFYIKHDDTEYVCKIIQSSSTKCYYASVTPKDLAAKPVSNTKRLVLIFVIIFAPIGLLLSYLLSQRNYTPLKRIIDWLDEKAMYDPRSFEKGNEVDILENALKLSFEEQEKLIEQIRNRKNILKISTIQNLLYGISSQANSAKEIFSKNDITLLSDQFAVILINIERKYNNIPEAEYPQDLIGLTISNTIENLTGEKHQGFVVPIDLNRYACLVNFSASDRNDMLFQDLLSIAHEGKKLLKEKFGIYLTISLSNIHNEAYGIYQAFQEALYAMEYRLTVGLDQIIPYKKPIQNDSIYIFSLKIDHSINAFIKEPKDNNQIEDFVSGIFQNRGINLLTPPDVAKVFIYDIAISLSKAINDMLPRENIQWKKEIFNRLVKCDILEQFRSELINILKEYQIYLREKLSLNSISIQVKEYIERNYSDPNLNINILSDKFNLSPSYLSRIFKEENGISIIDYISECRIKKAKELLKNTDKRIQEIAEETGFLSSSVFIRVFRKVEGTTPGSFRKL